MQSNSYLSNSIPSSVHPQARVGQGVKIGPFAVIGADVEIGDGTEIGPHVVIQDGVRIGKNCVISAGVVISSDARQLEYWREDKETASFSQVVIKDRVHLEPYVILHGGITLGEDCWVGSHTTIYDGARIGNHVRIFPGAVISAIPQDLKFEGEKTTLEIGDHTTIRECATLNRGTVYHGKTVIGEHVLIMAYVHVAHDCIVGDHAILANAVNLAGHVEVHEWAIIGGMTAVHQFVKIGRHTMISGGSLVGKDVPPFVKAGREPLRYEGVNSVGLRRRGFTNETIHQIQELYRNVFLTGKNITNAIDFVETQLPPIEERDEALGFIRNATRGIIKGHVASSNREEEV